MIANPIHRRVILSALLCWLGPVCAPLRGNDLPAEVSPFLTQYCGDCHATGEREGGFALADLHGNLAEQGNFARWERLFDRLDAGEMPPAEAATPSPEQRVQVVRGLRAALSAAHKQSKGTVLRRLNRREYQNTVNDLFGTNLDLAALLPEDGRTGEFDTVGASLAVSLVHMQQYMEAARQVLDAAIAQASRRPEPQVIEASYLGTREAERFLGKRWKELEDGAVVRFSGNGYPSGMMRGTSVRQAGYYRVRVRGYAYQSETPVTFSVGGTSFVRGSEKPIYGFWSLKPGPAQVITFKTWIDEKVMIAIEPYGIADPKRYQRESIEDYAGPGLAILDVTLEGPLVDAWPSRGHRLLFDGLNRVEKEPSNPALKRKSWYKPTFEIRSEDERGDATRVLTRVARQAFREPLQEPSTRQYITLFMTERHKGASFEEALRTAVTAMLCAPQFLYLQERPGALDGSALAARLAYFLTRTAPDETLRGIAQSGELGRPEALRSQTERLLKSERFERFLVDFTDSWLDLRDMDFTVPDRRLYPEFDTYLRHSMPLETRAFVRALIEENLPVRHLVESDFAMLNSRLAVHYALPAVAGTEVRKVRLPAGSVRGGLLAQAAILKVTANGTNTSPVTRGAWVLERMLGAPSPPPPPGVPGVEPDVRGAQTLRELLAKHRTSPDCNTCHRSIDPPGFALECFNPIGGWRTRYRTTGGGEKVDLELNGRRVGYRLGRTVDGSGALPDGRAFEDYNAFRALLVADVRPLARTLTEKLLTFATGRQLGFSDRAEVERIVRASAEGGYGVRDLIHLVVQSKLFRTK